MATDQDAIKTQSKGACKFVKFVGKKLSRGQKNNAPTKKHLS